MQGHHVTYDEREKRAKLSFWLDGKEVTYSAFKRAEELRKRKIKCAFQDSSSVGIDGRAAAEDVVAAAATEPRPRTSTAPPPHPPPPPHLGRCTTYDEFFF